MLGCVYPTAEDGLLVLNLRCVPVDEHSTAYFQLNKHFSEMAAPELTLFSLLLPPPLIACAACPVSLVATDPLRSSLSNSGGIFSHYGNAAITSKFPGQMCLGPQKPREHPGPTGLTFQ